MLSTIFVPIDPLTLLSVRYSNKLHRIALLVQLSGKQWTSLHWDLLREDLAGDVAIASDIEALTGFYRTFHAVSPETTIHSWGKYVLVFPDLQLVAQQFIRVIDRIAEAEDTQLIRVIDRIAEAEDTIPDLTAQTAIGMVAFLALHQHVLARHPTVKTKPLTVNSVMAVLRALLACCHDRITSADNAGTLASTIVLLIQSAEPEDQDVRQALHRHISLSVDVNIAADAVLDHFFIPGCGIKVPSWGLLTGMCDGRRLLDHQTVAAKTYLRRHSPTPLSPQQVSAAADAYKKVKALALDVEEPTTTPRPAKGMIGLVTVIPARKYGRQSQGFRMDRTESLHLGRNGSRGYSGESTLRPAGSAAASGGVSSSVRQQWRSRQHYQHGRHRVSSINGG
ncbi:unnamed protein product [Peniophora sp. CBMAI 1063]|nr:unnamed protein product [Peniophora sp. CBMAI 1063]